MNLVTNVVFPSGKVHCLKARRDLWTLCGIYRMSTLRETLKEVTCKKCLQILALSHRLGQKEKER